MEQKIIKITAYWANITDIDGTQHFIKNFSGTIAGDNYSFHGAVRFNFNSWLRLLPLISKLNIRYLMRNQVNAFTRTCKPSVLNDDVIDKFLNTMMHEVALEPEIETLKKKTKRAYQYFDHARLMYKLVGISAIVPSLQAILMDANMLASKREKALFSDLFFKNIRQIPDMVSGLYDAMEMNESKSKEINNAIQYIKQYYNYALIQFQTEIATANEL